jgi:hypothetical protein
MLGGQRSRVRERPVPHFGSQLLKIRGYRRIGASLGLKIRETAKKNISKGAGLDPYCKSLLSRTADPQSIVGAGYISSQLLQLLEATTLFRRHGETRAAAQESTNAQKPRTAFEIVNEKVIGSATSLTMAVH